MPIETKDLVGWAVTGSLGLLSLILNWRTRRDAKIVKRKESESVWSLRRSKNPTAPGDALFALRLEDADAQRLRLLTITAIKPSGVQISTVRFASDEAGRGYLVPVEFDRYLSINEDLSGDIRHGVAGLSQQSQATVQIFARAQVGLRVPAGRLKLRLSLEDISSRSGRKSIDVVSEPVDWAALRMEEDPFR